jgi:hypothetical protein
VVDRRNEHLAMEIEARCVNRAHDRSLGGLHLPGVGADRAVAELAETSRLHPPAMPQLRRCGGRRGSDEAPIGAPAQDVMLGLISGSIP